jgi:alkylated DNA nucleotide flippase Atl1
MPQRPREAGFALPATLFVVALVTIMLSAVFVRVSVDRRLSESTGDYADAFALAQSGLQRYLHYYDSLGTMPPDGDSLRINGVGGYADVVAQLARHPADSADNWHYVVRSTGHLIVPTQGQDPQAKRTVAQFAVWQSGSIRRVAAFTSVDPIDCCGTMTVTISGNDECSADVIGGFRSVGSSDTPGSVTGSPAVDKTGTWSQIAAELGIDWEAIVNGEFVPDISRPMATMA